MVRSNRLWSKGGVKNKGMQSVYCASALVVATPTPTPHQLCQGKLKPGAFSGCSGTSPYKITPLPGGHLVRGKLHQDEPDADLLFNLWL